MTFQQVFLDPDRHAVDLQESMAKLLNTLQSDPTVAADQLGDQTLLEYQNTDRTKCDVASNFGPRFAEEIVKLPLQQWHGPIRSSYGVHAVYITERTEGRLPTLNDVRDLVRRDWEQKHRKDLIESFYQGLMKKYEVAIEWPDPVAEEP
jgi:parvulin-like peptidyl-prolyl isomerase